MKGLFTRYDFLADDKLTTGLQHVKCYFIVGVIALRHLPTLLNVDVDVDLGPFKRVEGLIYKKQFMS